MDQSTVYVVATTLTQYHYPLVTQFKQVHNKHLKSKEINKHVAGKINLRTDKKS
jgi:hypothetical protein